MDIDDTQPETLLKTNSLSLHAHRLDHNPSKLPAFRFVDLQRAPLGVSTLLSASSDLESASTSTTTANTKTTTSSKHRTNSCQQSEITQNTTPLPISATTSTALSSPTKVSLAFPGESATSLSSTGSYFPLSPSQSQPPLHSISTPASRPQEKRTRKAPASHSSNGIETSTGPPPALSTQRSFPPEPARAPNNSTTEWALAQQKLAFEGLHNTPTAPINDTKNTTKTRNPRVVSRSLDETTSSKPLIPPIRSFRSSSTRASLEMYARASQRYEVQMDGHTIDHDRTLRALEAFSSEDRNMQDSEHDDQRQSDESTEDLFLGLAREDLNRQANSGDGESMRRQSRIALASHRQSLPPTTASYQKFTSIPTARRGSDLQGTVAASSPREGLQNQSSRNSFQTPRDRSMPTSVRPPNDPNRLRYSGPVSRSSPATPRGTGSREQNFESQLPRGGRRLSIPESNASIPTRTRPNRLSNLSHSSRVYNSSPLVSRSIEMVDTPETADTPRVAEGTESTASTTAPSTVWDELDDLKSRIRKLELTGKLPPTSGAAMSHVSGERPPTATTTITTISTSPKRGRGTSTSPVDSHSTGLPIGETHPLLHSALVKSKPLLSEEVYRALAAATTDALAIAAMMGSVGQPGPISSAQSVVGSNASTVTDRQLRRKADSMCRSLTELCLALSEGKPQQPQPPVNQALVRTGGNEKEIQLSELSPRGGDSLTRLKSSPRTLSRLEARRSSLLATSSLLAPRHAEALTPIQATNMAGRRTSLLLLRNRRAGTEELEDEDRFRAPSRAATEVGRLRNSPRDIVPERAPPLPDNRALPVQSSLPVRRNYIATGLNPNLPHSPSTQNLATRRYLDRSTPERDSNSVIGKLAEDRGQRVPRESMGVAYDGTGLGRTNSLTKKNR